jgi:hypothetical protein
VIWTFTQYGKLKLLTSASAHVAAVGFLDGALAGLYTNVITLSSGTVSTDLTRPAWAGPYADLAITWVLPPTDSPGGAAELVGNMLTFPSGADANQIVQGILITDATGHLLCAANLDTGIPVVGVQNVFVVPRIQQF